ncbi:MAG: flagellar basal body P-ring formation chaperone FlgA [Rhodocyclaceae bacterium]
MRTATRDCAGTARDALQAWLAKRYGRFEVEVQASGATVGESQECRIRAVAENLNVASRMTVWADVFEEDRFVRSMAISAKVSAFQDVWVASAPIAAGEAAQGSRFQRRTVNVARENAAPLPADWDAGGYRVARNMTEGQPLTSGLLVASLDVERGSPAVLTTRVGGVSLEAAVRVLQDGKVGTTVPVSVAGGKSFMARVVSPGRLEATQ